jgi:hypothetical protein
MHNLDAYQQIEKVKTLQWIKQSAIVLKPSLRSEDPEEFGAARYAHKDLVDRFYSETSDYIPLSQYKAAERDFEYFLRLIDLALAYFAGEMEAEGKVQ